MKKKMHKSLLWILVIPAALVCCNREVSDPKDEPQEVVGVEKPVGHPVTISTGLPGETRVSHGLDGTSIKVAWAEGDKLTVVFNKDTEQITETFDLVEGAGETSATFKNENSQLEENTVFDVYHASGAASWAVQDGTVANLPDYLSAKGVKLSDAISLQPCMTYFHIVLGPLDRDYASAYLSKMEGGCTIYSAPGVKGGVTVTPSGGFKSGESVDFYVAVMISGATTGEVNDNFGSSVSPKFQIGFADGVQGISFDGQAFDLTFPSAKCNWTPAKDYVAGKVYKVANKSLSATPAGGNIPR